MERITGMGQRTLDRVQILTENHFLPILRDEQAFRAHVECWTKVDQSQQPLVLRTHPLGLLLDLARPLFCGADSQTTTSCRSRSGRVESTYVGRIRADAMSLPGLWTPSWQNLLHILPHTSTQPLAVERIGCFWGHGGPDRNTFRVQISPE
ncbi:hypothetical protein F2P79_002689 [Pimephales promelas]|nr:hypothetical protein F2P79_002689 [Pimephales promelas]